MICSIIRCNRSIQKGSTKVLGNMNKIIEVVDLGLFIKCRSYLKIYINLLYYLSYSAKILGYVWIQWIDLKFLI